MRAPSSENIDNNFVQRDEIMKTVINLTRRLSAGHITASIFALTMFATLTGTSVKAASVTIDLIGTVIATEDLTNDTISDGNFLGTVGNGTLTFEDSLFPDLVFGVPAFGTQSVETGLKLTLDIFGQTFTEADSILPADRTLFLTFQGVPIAMGFSVSEAGGLAGSNVTDINNPGILGFAFRTSLDPNGFIFDETTGAVSGLNVDIRVFETGISAVPVPAALPLFGTGLAIMGFVGWRRKRKIVAA